jgi:hypothetical protein
MNSFLEDIEFASKVNEEIKKAEQRGIDNSLELTKEMIKQQYGDIEQLQQENKQLKEKIDKAIEYIKQYGNLYCLKHTQFKKYKQYEELLEILGGDNEN